MATAIARAARFFAARCPYSRAHIEVLNAEVLYAEAGETIAVFHDQDASGRV